jgi:hypothetical protein
MHTISNNTLGQLVPPKGWRVEVQDGKNAYFGPNGDASWDAPAGSKPEGVIAVATAIPNMRAMTTLNLANNELGPKGAKIVAEAIKVTKCTPAIRLVPFSCPSDFSLNCCCLLSSAGYGGHIQGYCQHVPSPHPRHQV